MNTLKETNPEKFRLKQWRHENEGNRHMLKFMLEESLTQKHRITEILSSKSEHEVLEKAESFHNAFLRNDSLINVLRGEIKQMQHALSVIQTDHQDLEDIGHRLRKLRYDMIVLCNNFLKLRNEFNTYLSDH